MEKYMYIPNGFVGPGDYIGIIPPVDLPKKETGIVQITLSCIGLFFGILSFLVIL